VAHGHPLENTYKIGNHIIFDDFVIKLNTFKKGTA